MANKVYSLQDAIKKFVKDGDSLAFSGFTTNRKPMAAVREILRQGQKDLIGYSGPGASDWDMLIGERRVAAYINAYIGDSGITNVSRCFRRRVENGDLLFEDYSLDGMMMMFHAASLGLTYVPVQFMIGSGIADEWGISREVRKAMPKLPDEKFIIADNPFNPGEKVMLLPAPKLDVAIVHVQMASPDGTCVILGDEFHDVDIAIAAKHTIITCEELVSDEYIRSDLSKTKIPGFVVDAVCEVPYGAHPMQCAGYYDYDKAFLREYGEASRSDEGLRAFLDQWIYDTKDQMGYLRKLGVDQLLGLRVTPGYGYHTNAVKEGE